MTVEKLLQLAWKKYERKLLLWLVIIEIFVIIFLVWRLETKPPEVVVETIYLEKQVFVPIEVEPLVQVSYIEEEQEEELVVKPIIELTQKEVELLEKIVEAESGICDLDEKVLVARVIINRVLSEEFPNDVESVVYQKRQFQPVTNGRINKVEVTKETKQAVNLALYGEPDEFDGLFFMNPKASTLKNIRWFRNSLIMVAKADYHEFYTTP
jgi:N-acetylmuramoyl-L-alanine amidase